MANLPARTREPAIARPSLPLVAPLLACLALSFSSVACTRYDDSAPAQKMTKKTASTERPAADPGAERPAPPVAAVRPHAVESPHGTRNDNYYWLRDDAREDPDVLAYLKAENAYKDAVLAPLKATEDALFDEIVARIKQDDSTVPFRHRGYYYYRRYEPGKEYPIRARKQGSLEAEEQILLDSNALAEGHEYYKVGDWNVSPDGHLLAWTDDTVGRRKYTVRFRDLRTGETLADTIPGCTAAVAWADDNRTVFYIEKDPVTLLGVRVKRHTLGAKVADDPVVHEEEDHSFYLSVGRTGDEKYVTIGLTSTVSDELRFIPADDPAATPVVLSPRQRDHEYGADHIDGRWVIRTNWDAKNFRLMEVPDAAAASGDRARWRELVPHRPGVLLAGFDMFKGHLVLEERAEALRRIRVRPWDEKDGKEFVIESDEPAYAAFVDTNMEQDSEWLRYQYGSLTTPDTIYDINMRTGERKLMRREPVLGGYDPAHYKTELLWATAKDGVKVPISLVYRTTTKIDGSAPLYQYAYGSYGSSSDAEFVSHVVSLLDRGFVYAIAHVRGGQEMGREWYDDGRLLNKINTFTDFIAVTEHLVAEGYAHPERTVAAGGSAGGLLMGAITNLRPDLYRVIAAHVPFVDVVTTMLDETIPLTSNEFDEWGNPKEKPFYDYMLSYSPYDNVVARGGYPALLVTTGLWDSQVQYFEPAKWVAKLRATRTDTPDKGGRPLLFHVEMNAGHGGKSGRFRRYRERAMEYAFAFDQVGVKP